MRILKRVLSKFIGPVVVCDGDIQRGYWDYSSYHRLSTLGTFGVKHLYLDKKLLSLLVLQGQEAQRYVEMGKDGFGAGKRVLGTMAGGLIGLLIADKLAKKETDKLGTENLICFRAVLKGDKRFVAIARPDVYQKFFNNFQSSEGQ